MTERIGKEEVVQLYQKYDSEGRDSWDVAAAVINELYPREVYGDRNRDAGYYYHIYVTWGWIAEYIQSTYDDAE